MDTSIVSVWLKLPGFDRCGRKDDAWDYARIDGLLKEEQALKTTLVLPLATIIEMGNHIANSTKFRFDRAQKLMDLLAKALEGTSPWAAFRDQHVLWGDEELARLAKDWPAQASSGLSIADSTISRVANHYRRLGMAVEILTGDEGLKALEPEPEALVPRRRQR